MSTIEFIKLASNNPCYFSVFSRLRNRKDFRLEGENLYVSFLPPICQRRCFLRDIPTSIVDEHLDDYMVARAKVDLESLQLSQAGTSRCALFTFKHDVGEIFSSRQSLRTRVFFFVSFSSSETSGSDKQAETNGISAQVGTGKSR